MVYAVSGTGVFGPSGAGSHPIPISRLWNMYATGSSSRMALCISPFAS